MEETSCRKGSNLILALDFPPDKPRVLVSKAKQILKSVHTHVAGVKFNRHLILPLGLSSDLKNLVKEAKDLGLPTIMDCKINDIGNTNRIIAEHYFKAGFDAVIANPFVGWEDGLEPVFRIAKQKDRGVILLVYMSHGGAWEGYGQRAIQQEGKQPVFQYKIFAEKALKWKADGVIVGATYPEKIHEVHSILGGEVPIYSPGVGAQGADAGIAIRKGTKYVIVGRAITQAKNPFQAAKDMHTIIKTSVNRQKPTDD